MHWVLLMYAFLFGVLFTVFCIKKVIFFLALRNLDYTSSRLKSMYEKTEELGLKKQEKKDATKTSHKR